MRMLRWLAAACCLGAVPAHADPGLLSLGASYYDQTKVDLGIGYFRKNDGVHDRAADFRVEYRFGDALFAIPHLALKPLVGAMVTTKGSLYGLGGLQVDVTFGHFVFTPSVAAGLWSNGGGKDMGSVIEFRTQIEAGWRFDDESRLTAALNHISNANIGHVNHGSNSLTLYYSFPVSL
jgi:hypothetical protein